MESCDCCGQSCSPGVRFWFCDRCRRGLRPVARKCCDGAILDANRTLLVMAKQASDLPELPAEMWTEIFQYLAATRLLKVRQVCRRWRDIVDNNSPLLAKLELCLSRVTIDPDYEPDRLLPMAKVSFSSASIAGVGPWWSLFGEGLTEIMMCYETRIAAPNLLGMLRHAPNLKRLELINLILTGANSAATDLHLGRLERFCLDEINSAEILEVFRGLRANIKCLSITWDTFADSELVHPAKMASFVSAFQGTLEELTINCSSNILVEMAKLDRMKLKKLQLKGEEFENDGILKEFLRVHRSLEDLDLPEILTLARMEDYALDQQLPKLKSLCIAHDGNTEMDLTFLSRMASLQRLSVEGCTVGFNFVDCGCCTVRELYLVNVIFPEGCLPRLLAKMPLLRSLQLDNSPIGCWLDLLEAIGALKQLRHLALDWIHSATAERALNFDLSQLEHLSVFDSNIPQELLIVLLSRCTGLRKLEIRNMKLSVNAMHVICCKLPPLDRLNLVRCGLLEEAED